MNKDRVLSIIVMVIGAILLASGIVYHIMQRPGGLKGIIAGSIVIVVGIVVQFMARPNGENEL